MFAVTSALGNCKVTSVATLGQLPRFYEKYRENNLQPRVGENKREDDERETKNVKSRLGRCGRLFVRQWKYKGIVLDRSLARTIGGEKSPIIMP